MAGALRQEVRSTGTARKGMSDMDGVDWPEELAYEMKERFKKWREEVTSRGGEG